MDQVVILPAGGDEAARLGDVQADARHRVGLTGKSGEILLHQRHHLRVEFDGIDPPGAVHQRLQHVAAGAGAEHQHARVVEQAVRQGRGGVGQVAERRQVAVVPRQRAGGLAVDEQAELWRRAGGGVEASVPAHDAAAPADCRPPSRPRAD